MAETRLSRAQAVHLVDIAIRHATLDTTEQMVKLLNTDEEAERKKLDFDLRIPFLVVAAVTVSNTSRWREEVRKEIMDEVCDRHYKEIEALSKIDPANPFKNTVDAELFLRDATEREMLRDQLNLETGRDISRLPVTSLEVLDSLVFEKRFLEYQRLFLEDLSSLGQETPSNLLKVPQRVYEHYSGKKMWQTTESFIFVLGLQFGISSFAFSLAKSLSEVIVTTEKDN